MTKPVLILDPDWRRMDELFSPDALARLHDAYDVVWGRDGAIPPDILAAALPTAEVLISASPQVTTDTLASAPNLRAIVEVSGAFPDSIAYDACFDAGVEVLSCAPGFRQSVAEMALAMILSGARGLVAEHEAFRRGEEQWLSDRPDTDFTLFGADIGFIGFGQIAQATAALLAPFSPTLRAHDPWLPADVAMTHAVTLAPLDDVIRQSRVLVVAAAPTPANHHMINAERLALMPAQGLLVVLSRAHLVDFAALDAELAAGRIRACIDVFPTEPVPADAPLRKHSGVILSPHRAAAVDKGRQLIGDMIVADLAAMAVGDTARQLGVAHPETIKAIIGVDDAKSVAAMADKR